MTDFVLLNTITANQRQADINAAERMNDLNKRVAGLEKELSQISATLSKIYEFLEESNHANESI